MTLADLRTSRLAQRFFAIRPLFFFFTLLIALPPAALAHTHPASMMPAANETVTAPEMVMIHFTGAVEPKFSTITVTDATGHVVNRDTAVVASDGKMVSVALPKLSAGVYTVNWVAVSVDSHRSQGGYKFTVK